MFQLSLVQFAGPSAGPKLCVLPFISLIEKSGAGLPCHWLKAGSHVLADFITSAILIAGLAGTVSVAAVGSIGRGVEMISVLRPFWIRAISSVAFCTCSLSVSIAKSIVKERLWFGPSFGTRPNLRSTERLRGKPVPGRNP